VILYSLGYRLGADFHWHKTGGIFIESSESGAEISVDGKLKKNTSLLGKNALIKNIAPGDHTILVSKKGFLDWQKKLTIDSELVNQRVALLIPTNLETKSIGKIAPKTNSPYLKHGVIYKNDDNGKQIKLFSGVKKFWELNSGDLLILGEDEKFYINNKNAGAEFSDDIYSILKTSHNSIFINNNNRIVFWDNRNIDSLWIGDENNMPQWQTDKEVSIFASPINTVIRDITEYPGYPDYTLITMGNGVFALNMDSNGGQNLFPIFKGAEPQLITNQRNLLTILDDGNYIEIKIP
jgi:hypothetical protein